MKTRPIGERFQDGDVTLKVQRETHDCDGCYYNDDSKCTANVNFVGGCLWIERIDKTPVIFAKVDP